MLIPVLTKKMQHDLVFFFFFSLRRFPLLWVEDFKPVRDHLKV